MTNNNDELEKKLKELEYFDPVFTDNHQYQMSDRMATNILQLFDHYAEQRAREAVEANDKEYTALHKELMVQVLELAKALRGQG
jgi:hypothetical protein